MLWNRPILSAQSLFSDGGLVSPSLWPLFRGAGLAAVQAALLLVSVNEVVQSGRGGECCVPGQSARVPALRMACVSAVRVGGVGRTDLEGNPWGYLKQILCKK